MAAPRGDAEPMTQKPKYSITNLGVLPGFDDSRATALNNEGQVVGTLHRGDFDMEPYGFLWHEGAMSGLGDVIPSDLNDVGQIVGMSRKNLLELVKAKDAPKRYTVHMAKAINQDGQVVGYSHFINRNVPSKSKRGAFILEGDERLLLTTPESVSASEATGINNLGTVVGGVQIRDSNDEHAVVWQDGVMRLLGEPGDFPNSQAEAVNDAGQILIRAIRSNSAELFEQAAGSGELDTETLVFKQQWYLWHDGQWQAIDGMSLAHSLNNQGQVVGCLWIDPGTALGPNERAGNHAAFWEAGELMDLNDVLPEDSGWMLQKATDINNLGQIVGYGIIEGKSRAFLLTPESL